MIEVNLFAFAYGLFNEDFSPVFYILYMRFLKDNPGTTLNYSLLIVMNVDVP